MRTNHLGNVLIIAYHFPPQAGSSGLLRSLKYCRYLPEFGWHPSVLTPHPRAYEKIDDKSLSSIPRDVPVIRAFAMDTKKHMGIGGRYLRYMALPDRWVSWVFGGVPAGLRAVRKHKIDVLYSTFPIMSAALIGLWIQRFTGLPWVLDLRDPMSQDDYPRDALVRRVWNKVERACIRRVSRVIFTAEATRQMYLERYPEFLKPQMCVLISNGYDEADFRDLQIAEPEPVPVDRPIRLVHSGLIYPVERDPRPMFNAVGRLKKMGRLSADKIQIVFRAPGSEDLYRTLLAERDIANLILLEPHMPYRQAVQECADADGLLLFQAADCDKQIPAKAYEYLRIGKPILALTTHTGDTAALLREVGGATIVNIASEDEIYEGLSAFVDALRVGTHPLPDRDKIRNYTREAQAGHLAKVLDGLTGKPSVPERQIDTARRDMPAQPLDAKPLGH
ncbi:MAG TPA: glycosyltransferase [Candidatus Acidoferrum sp.]|nr:glycosyltransferase [Candidatus Acidoferrum sp.]